MVYSLRLWVPVGGYWKVEMNELVRIDYVLVRTKTRTLQLIFLMFVAAMVIPFQIVMFPLLSWFRAVYEATGIKLLRTYGGMVLSYLASDCPCPSSW